MIRSSNRAGQAPPLDGRSGKLAIFTWAAVVLLVGAARGGELSVEKTDRGVTIRSAGELFTEYVIKSGSKPILWPIIGPTGKPLTRFYPMQDVAGEEHDHVHHRSLWFTHGEIDDIDFWSEGPGKGTIEHREFIKVTGGPQAVVATRNDWLGPDGRKHCQDTRTLTFRTDESSRSIDFDIAITASEGPLRFGETKEGSFGMRVASTMRVDAKQGGRIVNSEGQTDDAAWGKRASWVDYYGPIDGERVGIAILNHPTSFRFKPEQKNQPKGTYWHVRTYGLFAANPFGERTFSGSGDGSYTLPQGQTLLLRYRVVLHKGDEKAGKIAEIFEAYSRQK